MSQQVKSLRQPKILNVNNKEPPKLPESNVQYVILTLKGDKKLVISTDSYHGIIASGDVSKCVFCETKWCINYELKEKHKISTSHLEFLKNYPHIEEYSEHLLRRINPDQMYCTLCNVELSSSFIARHITSEMHKNEQQKATVRASIYKPCG